MVLRLPRPIGTNSRSTIPFLTGRFNTEHHAKILQVFRLVCNPAVFRSGVFCDFKSLVSSFQRGENNLCYIPFSLRRVQNCTSLD